MTSPVAIGLAGRGRLATADDGAAVMTVIDAARTCAATGGPAATPTSQEAD